MSDIAGTYAGLSEDELAELASESEQLAGEDASKWAARAKGLAEAAAKRAADRRAAEAAPLESEEE